MGLIRTLEVALEWEVEGDLFLQDIGRALAFGQEVLMVPLGTIRNHWPRLAIVTFFWLPMSSISVLQWLLNAETSHASHLPSSPPHRLTRFFTTLHSALRNPARRAAVLPDLGRPGPADHVHRAKGGLWPGVVVAYQLEKARKVFLCLFVGDGAAGETASAAQ